MSECLDSKNIAAYISGELPAEEKLQLNKHIQGCGKCKAAVLCAPEMIRGTAFLFGSIDEGPIKCPAAETMMGYVDGRLSPQDADRMENHLRNCGTCRE